MWYFLPEQEPSSKELSESIFISFYFVISLAGAYKFILQIMGAFAVFSKFFCNSCEYLRSFESPLETEPLTTPQATSLFKLHKIT